MSWHFLMHMLQKKGTIQCLRSPHPSSTKRASQKLIVPSPPGTRMGHGEVSLILGGLRTIGTSERGFSRTTEDHSHGTYNRATQLTPHFFFHSRSSTSHHRTSGLRFAKWRISNPRWCRKPLACNRSFTNLRNVHQPNFASPPCNVDPRDARRLDRWHDLCEAFFKKREKKTPPTRSFMDGRVLFSQDHVTSL